jgi:hypothetical protein
MITTDMSPWITKKQTEKHVAAQQQYRISEQQHAQTVYRESVLATASGVHPGSY